MKFDTEDHKIGMVRARTQWCHLDRYEKNLKPRSGVFIFADKTHDVKYVGKAAKRGMLNAIQAAKAKDKDYWATRVKALYTYDNESAKELRTQLKTKYRPLNNEKGV